MREIIDSASFTDMLLCAAAALEVNKQPINELNVFPVPDGDTGTNMSMTMNAGAAELRRKKPATVGDAAKTAADALLRGARGNSGVILSLLFRGLAKGLKGKEHLDAFSFAVAMQEGVDAAYNAVMKPAEGTILTVSRLSAAAAADFAENGSDVELLLSCALETAKEALVNTVNQNPVLKKAGVVDAGGKGYVVILEAMLASLRGEVTPDSYDLASPSLSETADFARFEAGDITFTYCTEFIVSRDHQKSADLLRAFLQNIGDSAVVVDDEEIVKVHVHTDLPGVVLTEALTYGSLLTVKIENMREQHSELSEGAQHGGEHAGEHQGPVEVEKEFGSVVVCAGEGMADLFRDLGVDKIITGGQTMNPSTEDILKAIESTPANVVYVLPNNKNIIMAAEQCAPLTEKRVVILPTKTIPQGVAAMLSMDLTTEDEAEITESAMEAIANVHTSLITYAARDSDFDGYEIKAGEFLGMLDGALLGSNSDIAALVDHLVEKLLELSPEFITVYYGEDVEPEAAEALGAALSAGLPEADLSIVNGGQPVYYYMIAAE